GSSPGRGANRHPPKPSSEGFGASGTQVFKSAALTTLFRISFWLGLCVVITLSLMPVEQLPQQVSLVWDKAQHAAGFAGLTLLGLFGYAAHLSRVSIGLVLTGALIEMAQHATGWRHG